MALRGRNDLGDGCRDGRGRGDRVAVLCHEPEVVLELVRLDLSDAVLGILSALERLLDRAPAGSVPNVVASLSSGRVAFEIEAIRQSFVRSMKGSGGCEACLWRGADRIVRRRGDSNASTY